MRIVEFDNGKFAVKRGWWFLSELLDVTDLNYWWTSSKYWDKYCMFNTLDEATSAMSSYIEKKSKSVFRVVKVHRP